MKPLRNKGQANLAIAIATTAIVLFVLVIVLGQLTGLSTTVGLTGAALAAFNNVSSYTWTGTTLVAIGIIVLAGMGLISMIGGGRAR